MNKDELIKLGLTEEQATKLIEKYGNMIHKVDLMKLLKKRIS